MYAEQNLYRQSTDQFNANSQNGAFGQIGIGTQANAHLQAAPLPPLLARIGSLLRELHDHHACADASLMDLSGQLFGYTPEGGNTKGERAVSCAADDVVESLLSAVVRARIIRDRADALKSALI